MGEPLRSMGGMMTVPAWLVPFLLSLAVVCLAIPMAAPVPRVSRGWAVAALVLGTVSGILVLLTVKGT